MWTECGKYCDHSSKVLKVVAYADNNFDTSEYSNLIEVDYYHSAADLLEYVDKYIFSQ